jgi:probable HAF family extracellular repeat protein
MNTKSKIRVTSLLILFVALTRAMAQFTYNVIDLGTLGGPTSTANTVDPSGQVGGFSLAADGSGHAFFYTNGTINDLGTLGGAGMIDPATGGNQNGALGSNARGEVVGFSATDDGSVHAFLFTNGQMVDLNAITDLSAGGFKVLTVAKAINDSSLVVGDGIMTTGDRHAFLLVPVGAATQGARSAVPTRGGQWSYTNDKWVWAASDGGWLWEDNGWNWNGPGKPPRHHPHTPPPPPPVPKTPVLPPVLNKTPILTPVYGKTLLGNKPLPPVLNKTPILTPVYGKTLLGNKLTPPSPSLPPVIEKTPGLGKSPVTAQGNLLTPPSPSLPPVIEKTPGLGKSPITEQGTPNASATPHTKRTKRSTPTPSPHPSPHRHTATPSPTAHGPKPSPSPENEEHHHHHHPQ